MNTGLLKSYFKMSLLQKLTPAETYLVIQGNNASLRDLLKYTLMDLLLKKVLKTTRKEFRPSKHDPVQVITYISRGKNFTTYKELIHERAFLSPFLRSKGLHSQFRNVVKVGYENSKSEGSYREIISVTPAIEFCFTQNFIQKIFGGFKYSQAGKEHKVNLQNELNELDKILPDLIVNDKRKALEILIRIKGNVFLLKNIDFKMLKAIDRELINEMAIPADTYDSGCWSGCSTWESFDTHHHTFDLSCSSDSGCGSSGCSGCSSSGCSGCSSGGGD